MATTSPDNIWTPDAGDAYALTTDLAATADTIQDALTNTYAPGLVPNVANSSGRTAAYPSPSEGNRVWQRDTDSEWYYDGTQWLENKIGLNPITPASAVGGSIGSAGVITFSSVSSVSVNGAITGRFSRYRIEVFVSSTSAPNGGTFLLRASGSNLTGSNYYTQQVFNPTSSTLGTSPTVQTSGVPWAAAACDTHRIIFELSNFPGPGTRTIQAVHNGFRSPSGVFWNESNSWFSDSTAADGFTFNLSTGTGSGWIRVWGVV